MSQVIHCASACTVTIQHEITVPLFVLTEAEAGQIGGAILLVWAVAFGFRQLSRMFFDGVSSEENK